MYKIILETFSIARRLSQEPPSPARMDIFPIFLFLSIQSSRPAYTDFTLRHTVVLPDTSRAGIRRGGLARPAKAFFSLRCSAPG